MEKIHPKWKPFFQETKDDWEDNLKNLEYPIHLPKKSQIFRTFRFFSPEETKLVILGQDPYPGYENNDTKNYYAEGLAFSVNPKVKKLPMSLRNIFKELKDNYPDFKYKNGSLLKWVKKEKILLLNTALTVIAGKPNSHSKRWKNFTDKVIEYLDKKSECLFLLMGNHAKNKSKLITNKNRILTCVHPSPLSASRGFFNSKIFLKINQKLDEKNIPTINFNLS